MLVGAHVSISGGLPTAVERGVERGCDAIQIMHQSPRAWRPQNHSAEQIDQFRELMAASRLEAVAVHAVYLINCASKDRTIRHKSIAALLHAVSLGDAIGAAGVVLHPGSSVGEAHGPSLGRVAAALGHVIGETERCPVLLEDTASAGNTLGRSFAELGDLIDRAGGHERLGLCLDCAHLLASGYDIRDDERLESVIDECEAEVGLDRLRCLHVNDSQVPLGSNVDRHANLPDGELGKRGLSAFLSEPRFEGLPALLEVPGPEGRGPDEGQIETARALRRQGLRRRARRGARR